MSDPNLSPALAALRPPAPTEPAAARALFRATLALAHASSRRPHEPAAPLRARSSPVLTLRQLARSLALPVLAAVLLLPLFHSAPTASRVAASPGAASLELLAQLQELFPGQLDAVIDRDGSLQIELSALPASDERPADQALVLELTRGPRRLRILAYSGRPVRLHLDHGELHFSPLLTGDGEVLLAGDDFAWTPSTALAAAPRALAGWQITARPLVAL